MKALIAYPARWSTGPLDSVAENRPLDIRDPRHVS